MRAGILFLVLLAGPALAQAGSADHPITVHMKRGADTVHLTGTLRQSRDCCAYIIKARAGQNLIWRTVIRMVRDCPTP